MADEAYQKLARVLDTLPTVFPATESGVEIKTSEENFLRPSRPIFFATLG